MVYEKTLWKPVKFIIWGGYCPGLADGQCFLPYLTYFPNGFLFIQKRHRLDLWEKTLKYDNQFQSWDEQPEVSCKAHNIYQNLKNSLVRILSFSSVINTKFTLQTLIPLFSVTYCFVDDSWLSSIFYSMIFEWKVFSFILSKNHLKYYYLSFSIKGSNSGLLKTTDQGPHWQLVLSGYRTNMEILELSEILLLARVHAAWKNPGSCISVLPEIHDPLLHPRTSWGSSEDHCCFHGEMGIYTSDRLKNPYIMQRWLFLQSDI